MELATTHRSVARETDSLMREVMGFSPKMAGRSGGQVLYLKHSELISDFLTFLGAPVAAMGIMEARLEKELNNKVNRRCNCDDANTSKVVEAAQEQLAAIRMIRETGAMDKLPEKLRAGSRCQRGKPLRIIVRAGGDDGAAHYEARHGQPDAGGCWSWRKR